MASYPIVRIANCDNESVNLSIQSERWIVAWIGSEKYKMYLISGFG